jgi:predicted ArsR family transcriptional regulator
MQESPMSEDFPASLGATRGQLITRLRAAPATVNDLAAHLQLTDNAVRAHLENLLAEGLVEQAGVTPGVRKPHTLYGLTGRAREHLSRLYVPVLNALLESLRTALSPAETQRIVEQAAHALAAPHAAAARQQSPEQRLAYALALLTDLGAVATLHKGADDTRIQGEACPLSQAVRNHPEVCKLVQTLLADVIGQPVSERCDRDSPAGPRCCFTVG